MYSTISHVAFRVLFICFLISFQFVYNQEAKRIYPRCLADEIFQQQIELYPDVKESFERLNRLALTFKQNSGLAKTASMDLIIPVVFHVNDPQNPEKVTMEQINSAMKILNDDFNALNEDFKSISPLFEEVAANIGIQMKLATLDPQGNPTQGVTYHRNNYCGREERVKTISGWPADMYLNIWVVNDVECNGEDYNSGWAHLPSTRYADDGVDGIVYNHRYLGRTGTSVAVPGNVDYEMARTLTHEVGHYLNLRHTFWGYCNNSNNDHVADTPPIQWNNGTDWCPPGGHDDISDNHLSCDRTTVVNYENYMDYSDCQAMFTEGQKTRMLATLFADEAYRNNLYTPENLEAVGLAPVGRIERPKLTHSHNKNLKINFPHSIIYESNKRTSLKINMHSLSGHKLKTLIDNQLTKGNYNFQLDIGALEGIFILKVTENSHTYLYKVTTIQK